MKKKLGLLMVVLFLAGCTNPDSAIRVLDSNGFKEIQVTGYKWFACSKDDFYHTGFIAVGPTGKRLSGCVCEGLLFKNSTIRFE